jgi:hypothetical protein
MVAVFRVESEDGAEVILDDLSRAEAEDYIEARPDEPIRMVRIDARDDDEDE